MIKVGPRKRHYSAFRGNAEVAMMPICQLVEELAAMVAASALPDRRFANGRGSEVATRGGAQPGPRNICREPCNDGSRHRRVAGRTQPGDHEINHLIKRRGRLIDKFSD
jgi:hypothetical protein